MALYKSFYARHPFFCWTTGIFWPLAIEMMMMGFFTAVKKTHEIESTVDFPAQDAAKLVSIDLPENLWARAVISGTLLSLAWSVILISSFCINKQMCAKDVNLPGSKEKFLEGRPEGMEPSLSHDDPLVVNPVPDVAAVPKAAAADHRQVVNKDNPNRISRKAASPVPTQIWTVDTPEGHSDSGASAVATPREGECLRQ